MFHLLERLQEIALQSFIPRNLKANCGSQRFLVFDNRYWPTIKTRDVTLFFKKFPAREVRESFQLIDSLTFSYPKSNSLKTYQNCLKKGEQGKLTVSLFLPSVPFRFHTQIFLFFLFLLVAGLFVCLLFLFAFLLSKSLERATILTFPS